MTTFSLQLASWKAAQWRPTFLCEGCFQPRSPISISGKLVWPPELLIQRVHSLHQAVPSFIEAHTEPAGSSVESFPSLGTNGASTTPMVAPLTSQGSMSTTMLLKPVEQDLQQLDKNLRRLMSEENPLLMAAADQIFGASGKKIRPALVFLVSYATTQLTGLRDITPQHRKLAEIIEMIHTASLIHDDVLDESDKRRGKETVNQMFGTRVAVLAGDFIFAQTSWLLANLENLEVIKLISQVIKDFASGEIKQATSLYDCDITMQDYLRTSYCKTASLVAASTKGAAIFSGASTEVQEKMYDYGKNLGLAFQIVDDILDFTRSSQQLGKPAGSDLRRGNVTAPVLYALGKQPGLKRLIQTEFVDAEDLETAIKLVYQSGGIEKAHDLAWDKGKLALGCLSCLQRGPMRSSLEGMVEYVLERLH
ncbi:hypothetical protein L7F22_068765 [Adiantum nelumboides]|nr:hypothetical protein [Adiantum nelumboides]